jgi:PleD family two-component response regulator
MGVTLLEKAFMMRILIADDHEMVRNATRRILESRGGIECVEARDGKEDVSVVPETSSRRLCRIRLSGFMCSTSTCLAGL